MIYTTIICENAEKILYNPAFFYIFKILSLIAIQDDFHVLIFHIYNPKITFFL